jgi:hypothetical protein
VTVHGRASEINIGLGDFALEVAEKTLSYLVTYSGVQQAIPPKIGILYKFAFILELQFLKEY